MTTILCHGGERVALDERAKKGDRHETAKTDYCEYDLGVGGEVALSSAVVLAKRCKAALRLVHVVEPLDSYQRISHPLTSPYPVEEIEKKPAHGLFIGESCNRSSSAIE